MKRHAALAPLSRDHHHALVIALKLRRATSETEQDAFEAFAAHWEGEEKQHFRTEEEILLPTYARYGDPAHPAITQMLQDHIRIRRDAELILVDPSLELMHQLGEALAEHVKLEEEHVFPLLEETLSDEELETLGRRLEGAGREA